MQPKGTASLPNTPRRRPSSLFLPTVLHFGIVVSVPGSWITVTSFLSLEKQVFRFIRLSSRALGVISHVSSELALQLLDAIRLN